MKTILQNYIFRAYALLGLVMLVFATVSPVLSKGGEGISMRLLHKLDHISWEGQVLAIYFLLVLVSSAIGLFVSFFKEQSENMTAFSLVFGVHLVICLILILM